jgi:tetratricopeptide (TPR) repeat protein
MQGNQATSAAGGGYTAFISYSRADTVFAKWLHKSLEHYRIPRELRSATRHGLAPIFLDTAELAASPNLASSLNAALGQSQFLIVVCSPAAARSENVEQEVQGFLRLNAPSRIIAVIVEGRPNSVARGGDAQLECFPPALLSIPSPLAADARAKAGGRDNALLPIVASLLGVGLDTLKQRALQRRSAQLMKIAIGAGAASVAFASLALYALHARRVALESQARATFEAQSARQVTQFLVDLFAISDPSETAGSTVTARDIVDRGAARLQLELKESPALRARMERAVGTVYRQLGLYEKARPLLESAYANTNKLQPEEVGPALFQLGLIQSAMDQHEAAKKSLQDCATTLATTTGSETRAVLIKCHRALAYEEIGLTHFEQARGELDAAFKLLQPEDLVIEAEILESSARLYREQAQFPQAETDLKKAYTLREQAQGLSHPDLAGTLYDQALLYQEWVKLPVALDYATRALAIEEKVYGEGHPETSTFVQQVGILYAEQGKFKEALPYFERSLAVRINTLGPNHTNTGYAVYNLGHLYFDMGDLDKAQEMFKRASSIYETSLGPTHPDLAYSLDKEAEVEIRRHHFVSAEALLKRSMAINEAAFEPGHPNIARTQLNYARLRRAQKRETESRQYYNSALATRVAKFGVDSEVVKSMQKEFADEDGT